MMQMVVPLLAVLLVGVGIAIETPTNALLGKSSGSVLLASLASFLVGSVALGVAALVKRPQLSAGWLAQTPWYAWVGGLYGAFLVRWATKKFGERVCIYFGLIGGTIGYTCFGLSKTGVLFWFAIPFLNLMSLTWPSAQAIMSRGTSPSEQGQLQGAINSIRGAAGIAGPGLFTYIFARAVGDHAIVHLPGLPFFTAASFLIIALLISVWATRKAAVAVPA